MLFSLPIESLEERYSAQWNVGFPQEFDRLGVHYETIYPTLLRAGANRISRGQFLDVVRTNEFKALQLAMLMSKFDRGEIKVNDVIFVHDLWYPGLEMLFYVRDGLGLKFKIAGLLHAGTYDPYDFLTQQGMTRWAGGIETSWWSEVDAIFVATEFHKRLLLSNRTVPHIGKVHVTGFPLFDEPDTTEMMKEDIVIFPHRLAPEKGLDGFGTIKKLCQDRLPGWQFLRTKDVCQTKAEYYNLLCRSKVAVSCAKQETWGIAQQEALFRGCIPVVPDRLSYVEMYSDAFRYHSLIDAAAMVTDFGRDWQRIVTGTEFTQPAAQCNYRQANAISKMVTIMREKDWSI